MLKPNFKKADGLGIRMISDLACQIYWLYFLRLEILPIKFIGETIQGRILFEGGHYLRKYVV